MLARDIMTTPVTTVRSATSVKEAAALLARNGFTALPVVEDDHLVGIVSEADLVRDRVPRDPRALCHPRADRPITPVTTTVGEVMTTPVTTMAPGTDIAVLAKALLDAGRRSMPIVDNTRLVGIVTRRDIVRVIARDDRNIAADIAHRLAIYGGDGRWHVDVHDGVVSIGDEFDDPTDRHVATVLAEAVPGVVRATAFAAHEEDVR